MSNKKLPKKRCKNCLFSNDVENIWSLRRCVIHKCAKDINDVCGYHQYRIKIIKEKKMASSSKSSSNRIGFFWIIRNSFYYSNLETYPNYYSLYTRAIIIPTVI
jgi:hypothetical protein